MIVASHHLLTTGLQIVKSPSQKSNHVYWVHKWHSQKFIRIVDGIVKLNITYTVCWLIISRAGTTVKRRDRSIISNENNLRYSDRIFAFQKNAAYRNVRRNQVVSLKAKP